MLCYFLDKLMYKEILDKAGGGGWLPWSINNTLDMCVVNVQCWIWKRDLSNINKRNQP